MIKLLLIPVIGTICLGSAIGHKANQLVTEATIRQAAYLCEAQYDSACRNLAVLTKGQCAAPGGWPHGCKYDSRVSVINDQRAVRDHALLSTFNR